MKVYVNENANSDRRYAVVNDRLILFGSSLYDSETDSKVFYNNNAIKTYLDKHGYKIVR